MTVEERIAEIDRKIDHCLTWPAEERDRLYQLLYLQGCRIEGIDKRITAVIRDRCIQGT